MGPIIILDKSAFQAFSAKEMTRLRCHFMESLTPILAMELLGDLAKAVEKEGTPERVVTRLAEKFGGSGPPVAMDYRSLCLANLTGSEVAMDGRIVIDYAKHARGPDGSVGAIVDPHPFNHAILRWSAGEFLDFERAVSSEWREATRNLSYGAFRDQLDAHRVIVPTAGGASDLARVVQDLVNAVGLQDVWVQWLLQQLSPLPAVAQRIIRRWQHRDSVLLRDHAPFAYHCVRCLLALHVAVRSNLVRWDPTHLLDLQYLYYLPFCMVFSSNDNVHKLIAPILLRDDQSFVVGVELKRDLRRLVDYWEGIPQDKRRRHAYALGSHPVPMENSTISALWKKHCLPWARGRGNRVTSLTEHECEEALLEAEELFRAVEA